MSCKCTSLTGQTLTRGGESLVKIPIIISCLTRQEFLGVLIDLVVNGYGARGCFFWHGTQSVRRFNGSPAFQNTS